MTDQATPADVRLDIWLDVSCLFKTRGEAQDACRTGRITVNRQPAKPNRRLKPGDELEISRPLGRKQQVVVLALADRHVSRTEARALYEDRTPKPTPEEIEARRVERIYHAAVTPLKAPDKRERRTLRRLRGRD